MEETPVPVRDLDTAELQTRGRERDHAAVRDRSCTERQHLGEAVLRAAEVLPGARDVTERARELVQPRADLEREEERSDRELTGAHQVGADRKQTCLHEQRHHLEVDVVAGEEPSAGHREAERALGDVGDALALLLLAAEGLDDADPAHRFVDRARDLGALVELRPAQCSQSRAEPVDQPDVDRDREQRHDAHERADDGDDDRHREQDRRVADEGGEDPEQRVDELDVGERAGDELAGRNLVEAAELGRLDVRVEPHPHVELDLVRELVGELLLGEREDQCPEGPERDVADVVPERRGLVHDSVVDHAPREVRDLEQADRVDDLHEEEPLQDALLAAEQRPEERRARDGERVRVAPEESSEPAEGFVGRAVGRLELRRVRLGLRH